LIQTTYGSGAQASGLIASPPAGAESYLAVGKFGVNADNTRSVDPALNAYSGIFGTAGSDTKWKWDGKMDHNTYAVGPGLHHRRPTSCSRRPTRSMSATRLGNEILNPGQFRQHDGNLDLAGRARADGPESRVVGLRRSSPSRKRKA
jgi:hypothetical protein